MDKKGAFQPSAGRRSIRKASRVDPLPGQLPLFDLADGRAMKPTAAFSNKVRKHRGKRRRRAQQIHLPGFEPGK